MAFALPLAMLAAAPQANAQRKNYTAHDLPANQMVTPDQLPPIAANPAAANLPAPAQGLKMPAPRPDHHLNKAAKFEHKMVKEEREINEDYNEALEKISRSTFSNSNKELLKKQANENKNLALRQLNERKELLTRHMKTRESIRSEIYADKANRKAVKEIMDILD